MLFDGTNGNFVSHTVGVNDISCRVSLHTYDPSSTLSVSTSHHIRSSVSTHLQCIRFERTSSNEKMNYEYFLPGITLIALHLAVIHFSISQYVLLTVDFRKKKRFSATGSDRDLMTAQLVGFYRREPRTFDVLSARRMYPNFSRMKVFFCSQTTTNAPAIRPKLPTPIPSATVAIDAIPVYHNVGEKSEGKPGMDSGGRAGEKERRPENGKEDSNRRTTACATTDNSACPDRRG